MTDRQLWVGTGIVAGVGVVALLAPDHPFALGALFLAGVAALALIVIARLGR